MKDQKSSSASSNLYRFCEGGHAREAMEEVARRHAIIDMEVKRGSLYPEFLNGNKVRWMNTGDNVV